MTFALHAACGRVARPPVPTRPLLATPPQEGDYNSAGNCAHKPEYRAKDGWCGRCGQQVERTQ